MKKISDWQVRESGPNNAGVIVPGTLGSVPGVKMNNGMAGDLYMRRRAFCKKRMRSKRIRAERIAAAYSAGTALTKTSTQKELVKETQKTGKPIPRFISSSVF